MKPSKADVAAMAERDYIAQLICWQRGFDAACEIDLALADNLIANNLRQTLKNIDSYMRNGNAQIHN